MAARMSGHLPKSVDLSVSDRPSILRIISDTIAGESFGLRLMASAIIDQIFPDTASGDNLDRLARSRGIYRLPGTRASGVISIVNKGSDNKTVGPGWHFSANGLTFVPSHGVGSIQILSNQSADISVIAVNSGISGNISTDVSLAAGSGDAIYSDELEVKPKEPFSGGRNEETDPELRSRIILRYGAFLRFYF